MAIKVDFRSDTVTKPTPGMLDAMMSAKVGDDVFGDDETVSALESKLASIFGMEIHSRMPDTPINFWLICFFGMAAGGIFALLLASKK